MNTRFQSVRDTDKVSDVLALRAHTGQQHFPVLRNEKITAMIDWPSLRRAIAANDFHAPITDYAISDYATAVPGDHATNAQDLMIRTGQMALPVFEAGRLIGIIDHF